MFSFFHWFILSKMETHGRLNFSSLREEIEKADDSIKKKNKETKEKEETCMLSITSISFIVKYFRNIYHVPSIILERNKIRTLPLSLPQSEWESKS